MASMFQHAPPVDGFTMARPDPIFPPLLHSRAIPVAVPCPSPAVPSPGVSTSPLPVVVPPDPSASVSPLPSSAQASPGITAGVVPTTHVQASSSPKCFRKLMSLTWQSQWDESQRQKKERLAGEAASRLHREKLAKSVVVWFWRQDARAPERYPVQGILGWPFFSVVDHPDLLQKLGVGAADRLERYDLSTRRWEGIEVSETFKAYSHQVFLWRATGVVNCPDIDSRIQEAGRQRISGLDPAVDIHSSPPTMQVTVMAAPTRTRRKRERTDDGAISRPTASRRLDACHEGPCQPELAAALLGISSPPEALRRPSPFLSNPPSSCTPPPPSSMPSSPTSSEDLLPEDLLSMTTVSMFGAGLGFSHLPTPESCRSSQECSPAVGFSQPTSPTFGPLPASQSNTALPHLATSSAFLSPPAAPDLSADPLPDDQIWSEGRVYVPPAVYMQRWSKVDRKNLKEEFAKVFPGVQFKSTYYRQEQAWKSSTEAERVAVALLPRTKRGLWSEARQSLSGWQLLAKH
ncbi:hypothetical protein LXA43DRAFT_1067993 [Ganoderma leucocontextum]|nr:hypothetical protein LXA43DRAFT_1067993 [Ganoderma leucocontextum]